jgi:hypothetical protein
MRAALCGAMQRFAAPFGAFDAGCQIEPTSTLNDLDGSNWFEPSLKDCSNRDGGDRDSVVGAV